MKRIDDVIYGFAKQWQQWSTNLETFRDNLVALPDLVSKVEIAKSQLGMALIDYLIYFRDNIDGAKQYQSWVRDKKFV